MLEVSGWYGKEFVDVEFVYFLLFLDGNNNIFKVELSLIVMNLGFSLLGFKNKVMKFILILMNLMLKIEKS